MTSMIPLEVEEIGQPQMSILKLSRDPDVLPPHNLCFYQGTDQPDRLPGKGDIFSKTSSIFMLTLK